MSETETAWAKVGGDERGRREGGRGSESSERARRRNEARKGGRTFEALTSDVTARQLRYRRRAEKSGKREGETKADACGTREEGERVKAQ